MNDVQRTCARLISHGARKGPEIVRFNAQLRGAWGPGGVVLPLRPRPANSNDPSMPDSIA